MGPEHVVLDISSDEEDGDFDRSGENSVDCQSSLDWVSRLLELEDELWPSEDVVVVDELLCSSPVQKSNSAQSNTAKCASDDDSDDECKILDGDPDKPVEVTQDGGNRSDDLLIVGEKGQLACRDYPHSRHLCATLPFSTTSHEKFCKLCHCYVCDIPAPCTYWGTGSSSADHCHSSDKEEKWRLQRKTLRCGVNTTENTGRLLDTALSIRQPVTRPQVMRRSGIRTPHSNLLQTISSSSMHAGARPIPQTLVSPCVGSRQSGLGFPRAVPLPAQTSVSMHVDRASVPLQNSYSRPLTFRHCSTTSFNAANTQKRSSIVHNTRRYNQQLNRSRDFSGTNSNQRECPPVVSVHTKGRMVCAGSERIIPKRPRTGISNRTQVHSRKVQSSFLPASVVDDNFKKWQDILLGEGSDLGMNFRHCTVYPQPEMYSLPYNQTSDSTCVNLLSSSAPLTNDPNFLDRQWFNSTSVNTTPYVSPASSQLLDVQSTCQYAVPESNRVSGEVPLGEGICSLGQEPLQEAARNVGLEEPNPFSYDEQEEITNLWYM